jgi:hypothetical protein
VKTRFLPAVIAALALIGLPGSLRATVDDALSFAYEAATPYVKKGFTFREDAWGGDLGVGEQKAVTAQLFKGNQYWFCLGTDTDGATVTIHVYDSKGKLAEEENWQKGRFAGTLVSPKQTGTYYAIVEVKKSPAERTTWALVYGYH